jgi:O-antigen ligase
MSIWPVAVLLGWGVLSLGAIRPWGYLPLIAGLTVQGAISFANAEAPGRVSRGLLVSLAAICAAIAAQLVPLPSALVAAVSPALAGAAGPMTSRPLTIDPAATLRGLGFFAALSMFLVGTMRAMRPRDAGRLTMVVVGLGTVLAVAGIAEASSLWPGVYRMARLPLPPDSMPLGPFPSRNHYAAWMLMALALASGYVCAMLERTRRPDRGDADSGLTDGDRAGWRLVFIQCAVLAMAVALVETRSRFAVAGVVLIAVAMGVPLARRFAVGRSRVLLAAPLLLLPIAGLAATGVRPIVHRFAADSWTTAHGRLPIWRQAVEMAGDFPLTGSGLNTYQRVVPLYPAPDLDEPYEGAHNDYLQLAIEGGLLVGLPAVAAIGLFVREVRRRFRDALDDNATRWIRRGAVVGLLLVAAQETVEFSLQSPGNAALFALVAAIAVHRGGTRSHA